MSQTRFVSFLVAITLAFSGHAFGHAHLTQSVPAADAILTEAPTDLELEFSEGVEARFSKIEIKAADGMVIPIKRIVSAPGNNRTLLVTPEDSLAAGTYTVIWRVISVDTHKIEGRYSFVIRP